MTPQHTIMGIPINSGSMGRLLARIDAWVEARDAPRVIVSANAAKLYASRNDTQLRDALLAADWVLPDGMGVVWASKGALPERLSGCDVAEEILACAAERGWRPYLLGGTPEVIDRAAAAVSARHPTLTLAGYHHGYLTQPTEGDVARSIAQAAPDVLLIGMGSPRQERFLARWAATIGAPCSVAVGGTFDVLSGRLKRAPVAIQRHGLEWAWRSFWEPRRLFSKRFADTVLFACRVAIDRIQNSS